MHARAAKQTFFVQGARPPTTCILLASAPGLLSQLTCLLRSRPSLCHPLKPWQGHGAPRVPCRCAALRACDAARSLGLGSVRLFSLLPPAIEWLQLCPPSVCALLRMHSMRERARMSAATHATCARALSAYIHRGQRWALRRPLFDCYLIWQSAGGARRRLRECRGVTREQVHAGADRVKLCLRRIMNQC